MSAARLTGVGPVKVVLTGALVAAALVLTLVAAEGPAEAAFPGENGRIVFASNAIERSNHIFTMNPDGSAVARVDGERGFRMGGEEHEPSVSPDGKQIAFHFYDYYDDRDDVFVMNFDGSGQDVLITSFPRFYGYFGRPAWSPDGSKLVFEGGLYVDDRPDGVAHDLFVAPSDGSARPTRITNTPDVIEETPSWSPNGERILFTAGGDIYAMDPGASNQTNLTSTASVGERWPDWSPDGERIAFSANQDLYSMNLDGSGRQNLTNTPALQEETPAWSPNGEKVAYSAGSDIYAMNHDGTNPKNLTNTPADEYGVVSERWPDWQPLPDTTAPKSKADCKKGGYKDFGFKNQGRCVAFVNGAANAR